MRLRNPLELSFRILIFVIESKLLFCVFTRLSTFEFVERTNFCFAHDFSYSHNHTKLKQAIVFFHVGILHQFVSYLFGNLELYTKPITVLNDFIKYPNFILFQFSQIFWKTDSSKRLKHYLYDHNNCTFHLNFQF